MVVPSPNCFPAHDRDFVRLVDGAFAETAARAGHHLACRPGCSQCCVGVFAVGPADVMRLEAGLHELEATHPDRYRRVRERARESWARLRTSFPGDVTTGRLAINPETGSEDEAFDAFGDDEPCPVLDPATGTCDLYAFRPHTCRVFGLPLPAPEGFGVCELCFTAASSGEIAVAAFPLELADTPAELNRLAVEAGAPPGFTVLAYVIGG